MKRVLSFSILFFILFFLGTWQISAQTYRFTTGGATGINGPTQAQINTAYSGTSLASAVTVTNGIQEWLVPVGGTYKIEVYGAQGYGPYAGRGAYMSGEFMFQPGDKIKVLVGQEGGCCVASGTNQYGGGGGTFVVNGVTDSAMIVAGGGGGAIGISAIQANSHGSITTSGNAGSGTSATAGGTNGSGGIGGSNSGGGGGYYTDGTGASVVASGKSFFNGGEGGTSASSGGWGGFGGGGGADSWNNHRAGGGGGYSGGGGGGTSGSAAQVGGGGGSYNTGMNQNDSVGVGIGDGKVIITLMAPAVMVPNNAGTMGFKDLPSGICIGSLPIKVNVKNFGNNIIDSVRVTWEVNGVVQGSNWHQVNLDTLLSANDETTVIVGNYNFSTYGTAYTIRAWTSLPNNVTDTVYNNDTSSTVVGTQYSGTYTVNSSLTTGGTNFQSFTELVDALNNYGVCGPLTINVSPGTYTDRLVFGNIPGASATNKIRINGNGATVQFNATSQATMHLLTFNGTKYVTIDSLTFKSLNATYGWGALITNASEYDSIIRCTFDLTSITGNSNANTNGITFTASPTSPITAGENGSNMYIGYSKVLGRTASGGPNTALSMYGNSGQGQNSNNVIEHNVFTNFYAYGMYLYYTGDNNKILYNDINRETKTSITTFYGIQSTSLGAGTEIIGNKIRNPYRAGISTTTGGYGLYISSMQGTAANPCLVANNVVYGFNIQMTQGVYFYNSSYTKFYHNTIVNDIANTSTATSQAVHVYLGAGSELKNNNIIVTGGSNAAKYGIYYASTVNLNANTVSGNNIYVNSSNGTDNYAYLSGDFTTQAAWQAVNPTIDAGSPSLDPLFVDATTGDLTPGNPLLLAQSLSDVAVDINGASRKANTGIGAFEVFPVGQNNAGTITILGPDSAFCPGNQQIRAVIYNGGTNNINRVTINWQVGNTTQTPITYTQILVPMTASSGKNMDTVLLGSIAISNTANSDVRVWTSNPNNTTDPVSSNDEARASFIAAMSGTYTVNSAIATGGTNFKTFKDLTNALESGGVCGPVVIDVTPATYSEKVEFGEIKGASPLNTIRINGNGAIVRKTTASTADLPILTLNGTKYLTLDSLTFNTANANYGWGALITGGAQYDSIIRCEFDLSNMTASSSTYSNGIVFSASPTSPTTAGENGSNIYIGYNTIKGNPTNTYSVYYGIVMYGTNGQGHNANNVIEHNLIQNFYIGGAYFVAPTNLTFNYNEITKKDKTGITGTTYGMYFSNMGEGSKVIGNRVHTLGGTLTTPNATTTYPFYIANALGTPINPIIVANNAVYNTNKMTQYGAYLGTSSNLKFYHNTISIDVPVTSTTAQYGIYVATSTTAISDVKNNIVNFTSGNTGTKYGLYYSNVAYVGESEMNNIYMNSSQAGTQYYINLGSAYTTRALYKASTYGSQYEINSPAVNPQFTNLATGDLTPQNTDVIGVGENLSSVVSIDINGYPRSIPPTLGAFREAIGVGANNAAVLGFISPNIPTCSGTHPVKVVIMNDGNNNITNLKIDWTINGVSQTQYTYNNTLVPLGSSGKSIDTITLGNVTITAGNSTIRVWSSLPNNITDSKTSNDTIQETFKGLMGGVYTINKNAAASATNFQSFANFTTALEQFGVCAPVVANVVSGSGPYTEQVKFTGNIDNISNVNNVRINGNGETVQFTATGTANMHLLTFDGAKFITIDSLTFKSLATGYGVGAFVTNGSMYDSIIRCTFDMTSITSASTYNVGIMFSASPTSYNSAGENGSYMYIGHNKVLGIPNGSGLYTGLSIYGSTNQNNYNVVEYNEFANFYTYGIYTNYGNYNEFRYNDIHRKNKTSITTFYGFYSNYFGEGSEIVGNRIHHPHGTASSSTAQFYGIRFLNARGVLANPILIANNVFHDVNMLFYGGVYISSGNYINIYHNTINHNGVTTSSTTQYGIYLGSTTINVRNNNVSITGGGKGVVYGAYYTSNPASLQGNNIYVNSSEASMQHYAYYGGTNYNTFADFQTANPSLEINSPSSDPLFTDELSGDLSIGNPFLKTSSLPEVPLDFNGKVRGQNTGIGAYELKMNGVNNAGIIDLVGPDTSFCPSSKPIKAIIFNGGTNDITSLKVNWSINGVLQPQISYNQSLVTITASSGNNSDTVLLGNVYFSSTENTEIVVWTSQPNNTTDPDNTNDSASATYRAAMSGVYTVNNSIPTNATNFNSFTEFTDALNLAGLCGPVTVNVTNSIYQDRLTFGNIAGSNAMNYIRVNGNGATLQYNSTGQGDMHLLTFIGSKYITVDNLNFKALNSTYGWGAMISSGAEYDSIINCVFDLSSVTGSGSTSTNGITFSSSLTSPTSSGDNGSNIYIGYNKVIGSASGGPYYGLTMFGSASTHNSNNVIEYNEFRDYYVYGLYLSNVGVNNKIRYNEFTRKGKSSITTFYGIQVSSAAAGLEVVGNRIHTPGGASASVATTSAYGLYFNSLTGSAANPILIANNAVYNFNQKQTYGMFFSTISYTKIFHNTISSGYQNTSTGVETALYFNSTIDATNELRNNNIVITEGGRGNRFGIRYTGTIPSGVISGNNIYVNSTQTAGTNYYAQVTSTNYTTQAAFQSANPNADAGSPSLDPQFVDETNGDLMPLVGTLKSATRLALVTEDINGETRSTTTAIGAVEMVSDDAASVDVFAANPVFCQGNQQISAVISNEGINNINSVQIGWSVNGVVQTPVSYTGTLVPSGANGKNMDTVTLGTVSFTNGDFKAIRIWTFSPNGGSDARTSNDTIERNVRSGLSGVYTVNPNVPASASNFQSFTALAYTLNNTGVCGPVVVNAFADIYDGQLAFNNIPGSSTTNTIRINGNGATLTYDATTNTDMANLVLNGTKYLTVDSLNFVAQNANNGWGLG